MDKRYKKSDVINGYSVLKIIGEGRYGIAYIGVNNKGEKCVIKQLKEEMLEKTREKLFYEEKILNILDDPKFPKFISKFKDNDIEGYILEYIEGKVFEDLIAKDKYEFNKNEIYEVASRLLELVEILQNNNIVHRDIRLPNIIIKENNELALIDFGLARFIDNTEEHEKQIDYWYVGDFLLHLYYSSYKGNDEEERPWYEELELDLEEKVFLKKLMGIEEYYKDVYEAKKQLQKLIS